MACKLPLAYLIQTVAPLPIVLAERSEKVDLLEEIKVKATAINEKSKEDLEKVLPTNTNDSKADETSAPDIITALKEAFFSTNFLIIITLGFSQDHGVSASLADWTISTFGASSVIGSVATGHVVHYISSRMCLTVICFERAILFIIFIFLPMSLATIMLFTCLLGFLWLSTVLLNTKFIGDEFRQRYLGTLVFVAFVGHQTGAFLGAYVGGLVYDAIHNYMRLWYASLALFVFAVVMNFFAGREHVNLRHRGLA